MQVRTTEMLHNLWNSVKMLIKMSLFVLFRFGWTDEHLAVIPRINALANCGKNQVGLVPWRAPVTQKFDAFCFNESGMTPFIYTMVLPGTKRKKSQNVEVRFDKNLKVLNHINGDW